MNFIKKNHEIFMIELKSDLVKKYEEKKLSLHSTKRPRVYKRETVTGLNLSSHVPA